MEVEAQPVDAHGVERGGLGGVADSADLYFTGN
jgi:hypothetical protein